MSHADVPSQNQEDHDSPWKGALEVFFRPFMDFLYSEIAAQIDWQQPVEFLDKELQKITRKAKNSRRYADKLVKVQFLTGVEKWILIHVEVQGEPEVGFAERMLMVSLEISGLLFLGTVLLPSIAYSYIFLVRNPILVSDKRGDYETFA